MKAFCPHIVAVIHLVLTIDVVCAAQATPPAGHWDGTIQLPGTELKFDVDLEQKDGAWTGDISIPAQGAKDLALADVKVEGENISFKLPGIPGDPAFAGTLSADKTKISGNFTQGGKSFPFSVGQGGAKTAKAKEGLADFDAFLEKSLNEWNQPGFAIAVVANNEVIYAKGFGQRDVDGKKPVTPETIFPIGSCTKAFTTFVMGTLVDEGKLEWDKPARNYLPNFVLHDDYATTHVTPRDMVSHRTGLPRHDLVWYNNQTINRAQIVERLRYLPPTKALREAFQYNNLMFISAGYLIETLTGQSWEQAVTARVFKPLGMNQSNFSVSDSQKTTDYALPYQEKDDVIKKMDFRNIDTAGPAGSINSNLTDMAKWVMVNLNEGKIGDKKIIDGTTLAEIRKPAIVANEFAERFKMSVGAYALGWMVDDYRGHERVHHGGAIDGFTAWVTLFPEDGVGMVAFANKNGSSLPWIMINHAADRVFDLERTDWIGERFAQREIAKAEEKKAKEKKQTVRKTGTKPAHELAEYAGEYEHPGYGIVKFEVMTNSDPQLALTCSGIVTPLEHWHFEVFNGMENPKDDTFEDTKVRFLTSNAGDVDAVAILMEPTGEETIFKRRPDAKLSDSKYLEKFTGEYSLSGQTVTIALKGSALTAYVPGQPTYDLLPTRNDEFTLKGLTGFSVQFRKDDGGAMTAVFKQPNGVFEAKKK